MWRIRRAMLKIQNLSSFPDLLYISFISCFRRITTPDYLSTFALADVTPRMNKFKQVLNTTSYNVYKFHSIFLLNILCFSKKKKFVIVEFLMLVFYWFSLIHLLFYHLGLCDTFDT